MRQTTEQDECTALQVAEYIKTWDAHDPSTWPSWYRWDGGWYESDGDNTCYCVWDDLGKDAVVFDVGAYEGAWLERMAIEYDDYRLCGFEPASRAFVIAQQKLSEFDNVLVHNFGLGAECGTYPLYDCQRDSATFVGGLDPYIDAEMVSIAKFLQDERIEKVALMALNIEGGEFELLPFLTSTGKIERIERIMIQWHSIFPNAREQQLLIQTALAKTHEMTWNHGAWEAWSIRELAL